MVLHLGRHVVDVAFEALPERFPERLLQHPGDRL